MTAVLVGSLAVAGCTGDDKSGARRPTATVATEPAKTTTTGVPVDQVPAVIDVAYVQRVIDALDRVMGDAVRELVAARVPNREFYERLRAVYLDPEFQRVQTELGEAAAEDLATIRPAPGDPIADVERLIFTSRDCVYFSARRSFEKVFIRAPTDSETQGFIGLKRRDDSRDPTRLNPTAWMVALDGVRPDGTQPGSPC